MQVEARALHWTVSVRPVSQVGMARVATSLVRTVTMETVVGKYVHRARAKTPVIQSQGSVLAATPAELAPDATICVLWERLVMAAAFSAAPAFMGSVTL